MQHGSEAHEEERWTVNPMAVGSTPTRPSMENDDSMEDDGKPEFGTATFDGETYKLRDYPYRTEDNTLVVPLENGLDVWFPGAYPVSLRYDGLDFENTEEAVIEPTMRYSSQVYQMA